MKALITRRSIVIASAALLIALVSIISINVFNSAGPVTGVANAITRPVRAIATTVAQALGDIYASIYRYQELENRYEELLRENVRLLMDFRESAELAEENKQFRELLRFRERHGGYDHEMATLESWNADNWSQSFVINRGYANSNIARGMAVATEYGVLIGQVSDVRATSSTVITILDTTFSAAAFVGGDNIDDADGTVTVRGDFTQMRNGLLTLDYIDDELTVNPGSEVFTSGSGGVFPSGLTIGNVVAVYNHTSGIGRYATVRPAREIERFENVFVITNFENPENPDNPENTDRAVNTDNAGSTETSENRD